MTRRMNRWATFLGVVLGLSATARAEEAVWRAVPTAPAAPAEGPAVTLGRPQPLDTPLDPTGFTPVAYTDTAGTAPPAPILLTQATDPPPPLGPPPPPPPNIGDYNSGLAVDKQLGHTFWERCQGWFTHLSDNTSAANRCWFQSDHCFDELISPVTNPFYFEDPRALTEVRPIFFVQSAPSGNPIFRGGNAEFFGTQARVAFTERLSFVINELGFVSLNPNQPQGDFSKSTSFAQFLFGPKYTFLRLPDTKTVMAGGLTFITPTGASRTFQNTGNLALDPYLTFAQSARLPQGFGILNFLGEVGYQVGTDNKRSDFFHGSLHVDYNIPSTRFYPLIEANWFHYTRGGHREDVGFEGADLANFGSRSLGGRDYVTLGFGLRYKFSECIQVGTAFEWPLTNQKEISDFRFTLDMIFRY